MPAAPVKHAQSVDNLVVRSTEPVNLTRASTKKKRRRSSSSLKKVRLDSKVYLKHSWTMWFDEGSSDGISDKSKLGTFDTVQGFWRYYNQIVDPTKFPNKSNLSIFKENPTLPGSPPKTACKWTIPTSKSDTGKVWMKVVLAMIGEQFTHSSDIVGVVISVYPQLDNIIVWGSDCSNHSRIEELTTQLRKLVENDTIHILSYQKKPTNTTTTATTQTETNSFTNNRKFVSSNDLAAEEKALKSKHKKSSSFSNTQFPDMSSNFRRHRKTKSSDSKEKSVVGSRRSISFSNDVISPSKATTVTTNQLSNQRMSLLAQMYNNGPQVEPFQIKARSLEEPCAIAEETAGVVPQKSSFSVTHLISLVILVVLVLSGVLFTPK